MPVNEKFNHQYHEPTMMATQPSLTHSKWQALPPTQKKKELVWTSKIKT